MQRYRASIQYVGSKFFGTQRQLQSNPNVANQIRGDAVPTVEGAVYAACCKLAGEHNVGSVYISSRTDKGVHALKNVIHIDLRRTIKQIPVERGGEVIEPFPPLAVLRAVNSELKRGPAQGSAQLLYVEPVGQDFHARYSAIERVYMYLVGVSLSPETRTSVLPGAMAEGPLSCSSVLGNDRMWQLPSKSLPLVPVGSNKSGGSEPFDIDAMQDAASRLVGRHDFTSFRSSNCQAKSPIKTLNDLTVTQLPYDPFHWPRYENGEEVMNPAPDIAPTQLIQILAHSRSFLYHQVRNIAGALVYVGAGKLTPDELEDILYKRDRTLAPPMAPPEGLHLVDVRYDNNQ